MQNDFPAFHTHYTYLYKHMHVVKYSFRNDFLTLKRKICTDSNYSRIE